jgi:hypothetical protein
MYAFPLRGERAVLIFRFDKPCKLQASNLVAQNDLFAR